MVFRIAGAYKITPEFNLGGLYQFLQHDNSEANPDAQVFGIAGEYKFAPKPHSVVKYSTAMSMRTMRMQLYWQSDLSTV